VSSLHPVEVWSPLPPQASGIADFAEEQLLVLAREFSLTLVAEDPDRVSADVRGRCRVVAPAQSDPAILRIYHVGNSPLHGFIYREALSTPGIVVLHEWNLHELLLGFAVNANNFEAYRAQMRREHGERGSVAAETIASALGGRYWTGAFPLNLEILESALAVVCLAGSTAARAAARIPGTPVLHLPHHALLRSHTTDRAAARARLGIGAADLVVVAPGFGTASKSLEIVRAALDLIRPEVANVVLVTVGGGPASVFDRSAANLGRVDLETLGDALVAADVVVALRFPSRGRGIGCRDARPFRGPRGDRLDRFDRGGGPSPRSRRPGESWAGRKRRTCRDPPTSAHRPRGPRSPRAARECGRLGEGRRAAHQETRGLHSRGRHPARRP